MGQRLDIEIEKNGEPLANCYYHWSAYTEPACDLINTLIETYDDLPITYPSDVAAAVAMLQATGAGINNDERKRIINNQKQKFDGIDFAELIDRNYGILAVTEKGMSENQYTAEEVVVVDIGLRTVNFGVYFMYDSIQQYVEECNLGENEIPKPKAIHYDISAIPFSLFDDFTNLVKYSPDGVVDDNGNYYSWIA